MGVPPAPLPVEGISWVAPGRLEDQPDAALGRITKAYHAMQDAHGLWYIVHESGTGELVIDARDIHHLSEVLDELRGASRNLPGVEVHIDATRKPEGGGYTKPRRPRVRRARRAER